MLCRLYLDLGYAAREAPCGDVREGFPKLCLLFKRMVDCDDGKRRRPGKTTRRHVGS